MKNIRIVNSTGDSQDTRVYVGNTEVTGVYRVVIDPIEVGGKLSAIIQVHPLEIDLVVSEE